MKSRHYVFYPRNFWNEYSVIRVDSDEEEQELISWKCGFLGDNNYTFEPITMRKLRKLKSDELHARKYDRAFSGYCNPDNPMTVREFIDPCY